MQQYTMRFESTIADVEPVNHGFSKCKVFVMYHGLNRNNSFISKDVVEAAIPTIYNIPIVGEFKEEKNDFGSHGGKIVIDDSGVKYVKTTMPYGVVPESATWSWQMKTDDDGVEREYLVVDGAYLWTGRYEEANKVLDTGKSQSMEVEFDKATFDKKKKITTVDAMTFSALCILGDDVEPAFEGSEIVESFSSDKETMRQFVKEVVFELEQQGLLQVNKEGGNGLTNFDTKSKTSDEKKSIDIDNSKDAAVMDGSWSDVDKSSLRDELTGAANAGALVKEGYLIVDADWKDAPSESLHYPHHVVKDGKLVVHKAGLEAAYARLMQNDPNNEAAKRHVEKHYKELGLDMSNFSLHGNFSLSSEQLENELRNILRNQEMCEDFWGWQSPRYWYVDNKDSVVVAQDCQLGGLVGFNFTQTGDLVTVDFDSGKRFKIEYVEMDVNGKPDGDEGVTNATDGDEFSFVTKERMEFAVEMAKAKKDSGEGDGADTGNGIDANNDENAPKGQEQEDGDFKMNNEDFEKLQADFEALKTSNEAQAVELETLRQFKAQTEEDQRKAAEEALFARFAPQMTEEEVTAFKEKASQFSLEELETQLFALVGKKAQSGQFSLTGTNGAVRVPMLPAGEGAKPSKYGDLFDKYGNK